MNAQENTRNSSGRLREIVSTLTKYGIANWLKDTKIEWIKKQLKDASGKDMLLNSREERIRLALTELGTTFIKLGQVLSTRSDLIGTDLADELSKLQASTPKDGIAYVRKCIKRELGVKDIQEVFLEFSTKPIASASIAQVHKAVLKTGEEVAVKVMHYGIEGKVMEDLKILKQLAKIAQAHGGPLKAYQPLQVIRQFSRILLDELDFRKELTNLEKFALNFEDDDRVVLPKPYRQFSGKEVLVMSFLEGTSLQKIDDLEWSQEQKSDFTEASAEVFMEMMFRDRFYHADPHPGNLFVMEDGSLGIIDCGMIGRLDSRINEAFEELIIGVAQKDGEHIKNIILNLGALP